MHSSVLYHYFAGWAHAALKYGVSLMMASRVCQPVYSEPDVSPETCPVQHLNMQNSHLALMNKFSSPCEGPS